LTSVRVPIVEFEAKRFVDDAVVEKKLVEVAFVSVVLPLKVVVAEKVLVLEKVLLVVVENDVEKTPVEGLYESGYEADKEDEEILLLKVVQSVEARKPLPVLLACASESVLLESENGPENESELMAPTPLPMRMPEGVEEPVPPLPTPKVPKMLFVRENVEVAETVPFADACRNPAPVESVRAEVEAPALKVCSWEKPLAAFKSGTLMERTLSGNPCEPVMFPAVRLVRLAPETAPKRPLHVPEVMVPTPVSDEERTLEARVAPVIPLAATEPALPVMEAFIEVVEIAEKTPALIAARPFEDERFTPVPPYCEPIAVPCHVPALIVPKALEPLQVLLLESKVEDAAVMV
jgi:hypothetical protein